MLKKRAKKNNRACLPKQNGAEAINRARTRSTLPKTEVHNHQLFKGGVCQISKSEKGELISKMRENVLKGLYKKAKFQKRNWCKF